MPLAPNATSSVPVTEQVPFSAAHLVKPVGTPTLPRVGGDGVGARRGGRLAVGEAARRAEPDLAVGRPSGSGQTPKKPQKPLSRTDPGLDVSPVKLTRHPRQPSHIVVAITRDRGSLGALYDSYRTRSRV